MPNVKKLVGVARSAEVPIIYTKAAHYIDGVMVSPLEAAYQPELENKFIVPGSYDDEICEELKPEESDHVIRKYRFCSFHGTELETLLNTINYPCAIDTLIITGTVTNICCESTARTAFMKDYKVAFTSDGTGGLDQRSQDATLEIMGRCFARVMTVEEIIEEMR